MGVVALRTTRSSPSCPAAACLLPELRRRGVLRVRECEHPHESGHDCLVELELLGDQIAEAEDTGQIAPGMPKAVHISGSDRVDGVEEDDRGVRSRRRGLRLADRLVLECDDQGDVLTDERLRLRLRRVLVRQVDSRDQVDVAALDPAELPQAGLQRLERGRDVVEPHVH